MRINSRPLRVLIVILFCLILATNVYAQQHTQTFRKRQQSWMNWVQNVLNVFIEFVKNMGVNIAELFKKIANLVKDIITNFSQWLQKAILFIKDLIANVSTTLLKYIQNAIEFLKELWSRAFGFFYGETKGLGS